MKVLIYLALNLAIVLTATICLAGVCPNREVNNGSNEKQTSSSSSKLPPSIEKLQAELARRAQIMAEERKLKGEKPVPNRINDGRILYSDPSIDVYSIWNPEYEKLTLKGKFAFWYVQHSVEFYYAYYHRAPADLEEFITKNYLPFTLDEEEVASVTKVLKLYGWNINDTSVALREMKYEKMEKNPNFSQEQIEEGLPVFMFNHAFNFALNNYLSDAKTRFKPTFTDMYNYIKSEFGVNDKFWDYVVDSNGNPKGEIFFIKERSEEKVPADVTLDKGDLLVTYYEYSNSDCGCDDIPAELVGKVRSLGLCILY